MLAVEDRRAIAPRSAGRRVQLRETGRLWRGCEEADDLAHVLTVVQAAYIDRVLAGDYGDPFETVHSEVRALGHNQGVSGVR